MYICRNEIHDTTVHMYVSMFYVNSYKFAPITDTCIFY